MNRWPEFAYAALSARVPGAMAEALLVAGAVLGADAMCRLIAEHREVVDAHGERWGVDDLAALGEVGLDAAGGALLLRILGRHAQPEAVDALQQRLADARREFALLATDYDAGVLDDDQHHEAVAALADGLASH